MAVKFLNHIDLNKNELQNAVIQPLGTAPSNPVEGQIYYNGGQIFLCTAGGATPTWKPVSGDIEDVAAGDGISVALAGGIATVSLANIDQITDGTIPLYDGINKQFKNSLITYNGSAIVISTDLTVTGTTTYVNTTDLQIGDNIITLNADIGSVAPSENAGIEVKRGTGTTTTLRWNETSDRWEFTNNGSTYYNIPISTEYNNYSHPTGDGNLHVPATGTTNSGKVLTAGATAGSLSWQANIAGNAGTATTLATARNFSLSGDVTAPTVSFNGSSNVILSTTLAVKDLTLFPTSNFKKSVKAATTGSITLSGLQTVDGVALVANDRVLVKSQTAARENGIYLVKSTAWTRSVAADGSTEIDSAIVAVDQGTINGGYYFTNVFKSTDVVGTTDMPWYRAVHENGTWAIGISGNAATATKLATARSIALSGDVTGSASFDGSGNISIAATIAANSVALGTDTTGNYVGGLTGNGGIVVTGTAGEGYSPNVALAAQDLTLFPTSNYKKSVRAATTGNITLSGIQTIDTVVLVAGNRVLVKSQTAQRENGIYIVATGAWTRSTAADGSTEIDSAIVAVDEGATNGGFYFTNVFKSTDVVGTTNMPWYRAVHENGTWGISVSGSAATLTTARTLTIGSTGKTFNGSANVSWSLTEIGVVGEISKHKHVQTFGDATNTSYVITHALATRDVIIQLYDAATYDTIYADVARTSTTTATVTFSRAPGVNAIRFVGWAAY